MRRLVAIALAALGAASARADLTWESQKLRQIATPGAQEIRFVFRFANAGPGAARIIDVKSSCGCAVATPSKLLFAPGETGEIVAALSPGARRGAITKSVIVHYEAEGKRRRARLSLSAEPPRAWSFDADAALVRGPAQRRGLLARARQGPAQLIWAPNEPRTAKSAVFRVAPRDGRRVRMLRLSPSNDAVRASFEPLPGDAYAWRIRVQPVGPKAGRPFFCTIRIETDWKDARDAVLHARSASP